MKKMISMILSIMLMITVFPAAVLGADRSQSQTNAMYGDLEVTLQLDHSVPYVKTEPTEAYFQVTLQQGGRDITNALPIQASPTQTLNYNWNQHDYKLAIQARNEAGFDMDTDKFVASYKLNFKQLPQGSYTLKFTGKGYTAFTTQPIAIDTYAKHVTIGTMNGTFNIGDVDDDGQVTKQDLTAMEQQIASAKENNTYNSAADLNQDGQLDVTDLAYIYHNMMVPQVKEAIIDTKLIDVPLDTKGLADEHVSDEMIQIIQDLLNPQFTDPVKLDNGTQAISTETPVELPIFFKEPVMVAQIVLESSAMSSAPSSGEAIVTYEENGIETENRFPFQSEVGRTVMHLSDNPERQTIEINLGKQVAVKKVVFKIIGTVGADSTFANVAKVEFIKDIASDKAESATGIMYGFEATAKDKAVQLAWNPTPNVTGYKVSYGTEKGIYTHVVPTDQHQITINGLEDYTTYYFIVQATNGQWEGPKSIEVSAMPIPATAPDSPHSVKVTIDDQMLWLTWTKSKAGTSYNVYYRAKNETNFTKSDRTTNTRYTLTDLKNDVDYYIYVTASNSVDESAPSEMLRATPKAMLFEAPNLPKNNQIANRHIQDIQLVDKGNFDPLFAPNGYNPRTVVDGDYNTVWSARNWWSKPEHIITFDQAYDMNFVVLVPRLSGRYFESLKSYVITVWGPNDDLNGPGTTYEEKSFVGSNLDKRYLMMPFPRSEVKQIKIGLYMYGGAPALPSAAEFVFYNYYSLDDDIRALFADDAYTTIAPTATQAEIDRLRLKLNGQDGEYFADKDIQLNELAMAEALLKGDTSKLGRVVAVNNNITTDGDSARGFAFQMNDYQPLGVAAKAGSDVVLYVSTTGKELPQLIATQYFPSFNEVNSTPIRLKSGKNVIHVPKVGNIDSERGGALYVTYHGQSTDTTVQVKGGALIPMLTVDNLEPANKASNETNIKQYITTLGSYVAKLPAKDRELHALNATEISMPDVLLSLPASQILAGIQTGGLSTDQQVERVYNSLLAWQDQVEVVYRAHGISKNAAEPQNSWPNSRFNIRYNRMSDTAAMYATSGHIGIRYGNVPGMAQGVPIAVKADNNGLYGWGIAHEMGHVVDQKDRIYPEITNNIYSLFAQTYDGVNNTSLSRLELSDKYEDMYRKVSRPAQGKPNDVFVALGMYWQLHLAYDGEGAASFDFYSQLHQLYRDKAYRAKLPTKLDQDSLLVAIASDTVKKDLTSFFEHWGYVIDPKVKKYLEDQHYAAEARALYYLNDEARRYRLAGNTGMAADIQLQLNSQLDAEQKQVTLTVTTDANAKDILGYEIYRNGQPIGFTAKNTYTDIIGATNNQTITYEVIAYDKLLNTSKKVQAAELKISHDVALSKSGWKYTTTNPNEIVIDMKSVQQTAGMRLNLQTINAAALAAGEHSYTVETSVDNENWTTAKVSSVELPTDRSAYTLYFNKPGTDASDPRIWTYDASYIRIHGDALVEALKTNVADSIDILAYPGDNIEIAPGAIGYLKEDYVYGKKPEDVIKKGTLIVTGSYRGDPVFNAIALKGLYNVEGQFGTTDQLKERLIAGYGLMFAEIPADGAVSEISNGFWLFVLELPSYEADHKDDDAAFPEHAHELSVLPNQIRAELYRSHTASNLQNSLKVSDTIWITSPDEKSMPWISLIGDNK